MIHLPITPAVGNNILISEISKSRLLLLLF